MRTREILWRLVRFRPGLYAAMLAVHVAYFTIDFGVPLLVQALFDRIGGKVPLGPDVWVLIALLVASRVGRGIFLLGLVTLQLTFHPLIAALVRRNLFAHILGQPGAQILPEAPGEAINRFRDDAAALGSSFSTINVLIGYSAAAIFGLIVMLRIDASVTIVTMIPLLAIILIAQRLQKRVAHYRQQSRDATGAVTGTLGEIFGAVPTIQGASAERRVVGHLAKLGEVRRRQSLRDKVFSQILDAVFMNTSTLGNGLILLLVAQAMRAGSFTVGDYAVFAYFLAWIGEFVSFLGMAFTQYKQLGVAVGRLERCLSGAPTETLVVHHHVGLGMGLLGRRESRTQSPSVLGTDPEARSERATLDSSARFGLDTLDVSALTYHHPETKRGIEEIRFSLQQGTLTVITGRVGSGKTTLLRVLLGLLPKETGEIRWNGETVDKPSAFFVPPRCAYVPQVPRLFSDHLNENILLGLPVDQARLRDAIHRAVLDDDVVALVDGLETVVGPRGVKLSGGQLQRAAAARALVREPSLLVVDDLSSALDVDTERLLWERLSERADLTILAVSHRPVALERADQIIVLDEGHIAVVGQLDELLVRCEEMRQLWQRDVLEVAGER